MRCRTDAWNLSCVGMIQRCCQRRRLLFGGGAETQAVALKMLSAPCCVPQEGLVTGDDCCRCHAWGWSICSAHAERATPGAVIFASAPSAPSWTRDGARCAPCFCRVLGLGYCFVDVLGARACPLGPPALVKGPGQARSRWSVGALQLIGAAYPPWQPRCRCVDGVETRGRRCRRDGVRAATRTARASTADPTRRRPTLAAPAAPASSCPPSARRPPASTS